MTIHLLTGNQFKIETAKSIWEPMGIAVSAVTTTTPEIQANTNIEIARVAALDAARQLNQPVAREDHGFFLRAVPSFPGPYMAYLESTIDPQVVLDILEHQDDRSAYFVLAMAYATPEGHVTEFIHEVPCTIATEIRPGNQEFGWDKIICLAGENRALSEYPQSERYEFFTKNYQRLGEMVASQQNPEFYS